MLHFTEAMFQRKEVDLERFFLALSANTPLSPCTSAVIFTKYYHDKTITLTPSSYLVIDIKVLYKGG